MTRHLTRLATAATFLLTVGVAPSAADTVTFNNQAGHPGGTFSLGGNVTLALGAIDNVARVSPLLDFAITGTCGPASAFGCIDLSTGTFVGPVTTTTANDYAYMGGGSLAVHGGIASLLLPNTTLLFSASFDSNSNVIIQFDDDCQITPAQCTGSLTGTLGPGTIHPVLAAAMGVNPNSIGGNEQTLFFTFSGISMPTDSFAPSGTASGNTTQLQVVTPAATTAVPEPSSLLLLGSSLFLFARAVRNRVK